MKDLPDSGLRQEASVDVGAAFRDFPEWQALTGLAIRRKYTGDIEGAIEALLKAIALMRTLPLLIKERATNLNYLADLYLEKNATEKAEEVLRESINLSRPEYPGLLADNLWILAGIEHRKGDCRAALASAEEAQHLYQQQEHAFGVSQAEELIETIKASLE
jgi:tetratricopeptide (TPR) repeat protein